MTTPTRLVTAKPDGTLTQELSLVPERVKRSGTWTKVDTRLVPNGKGRLTAASTTSDTSVSDGGYDPLVRVEDGAHFFELRWNGALPAPIVDGNKAVYPGVANGVDLVAVSGEAGFSTYFVVKSRAAAAQLDASTFKFTWRASAGLSIRATDTAFQVVDSAGNVAFDAPALAMWDSADIPEGDRGTANVVTRGGDSRRRPVGARIEGNSLQLLPDMSVFTAEDTVFPVVVDPASTALNRSNWLMVWSNGITFRNSATENARVGYDGWQDNKISRVFYRFDLSALMGRNVTKATLSARQVHSPSFECKKDTSHPGVQAFRTGDFTSSSNWGAQPAWTQLLFTSNLENGSSQTCGGFIQQDWAVTPGVQTQISSSNPVLTLGLKSANESNRMGWRQYDNTTTNGASFPKLVVEYYGYPTTPSTVSYSQGDGNPLIQGKFIRTTAIRMTTQVTNPPGFAAAAAVFRFTASNGKAYVVAGNEVTASGPSQATLTLPEDGTYTVTVNTCVRNDGPLGSCSAPTTPVQIIRDTTGPTPPKLTAPDSVQTGQYWNGRVIAEDRSTIKIEYEFFNGPKGTTDLENFQKDLRMAWSVPGRVSVRLRGHDAIGNVGAWSTPLWIKIYGPDAGLAMYRYPMTGNGNTAKPLDSFNPQADPEMNLGEENFGSPRPFVPAVVSPASCSNQVFAPGGRGGLRMIKNVTGTPLTDRPFTLTALVRPSADDFAWVAAEPGRDISYTWAVSASSVKAAYITLANVGGQVRWVGVVAGQPIHGPVVGVEDLDSWQTLGITQRPGVAPSMYVGTGQFHATAAPTPVSATWFGIGSVSSNTSVRSFSGQVDEVTWWAGSMPKTEFDSWAAKAKTACS